MQYGFLVAVAGLLTVVNAAPAAEFIEKDYYGSCHFTLTGIITAPDGQCLIHTPSDPGNQKTTYYCNKSSKCENEGDPCHIHCVPSPYGGGSCVAKCDPASQHPANDDN